MTDTRWQDVGEPGAASADLASAVRAAAVTALARLDLAPVAPAAAALAERVRAGRLLHVLGSGHSQLMAFEGFYRAGAPGWVAPVVDERLSPARGVRVTTFERGRGLGRELVHCLPAGGALLVVSTSGRNPLPVEAAQAGAAAGMLTIAITRRAADNRLMRIVAHVLDTAVPHGDAAVEVAGARMAPLSTIVGAVLLHALLASTEAALGGSHVLISNNVEGGDRHNAPLISRYPHLRP